MPWSESIQSWEDVEESVSCWKLDWLHIDSWERYMDLVSIAYNDKFCEPMDGLWSRDFEAFCADHPDCPIVRALVELRDNYDKHYDPTPIEQDQGEEAQRVEWLAQMLGAEAGALDSCADRRLDSLHDKVLEHMPGLGWHTVWFLIASVVNEIAWRLLETRPCNNEVKEFVNELARKAEDPHYEIESCKIVPLLGWIFDAAIRAWDTRSDLREEWTSANGATLETMFKKILSATIIRAKIESGFFNADKHENAEAFRIEQQIEATEFAGQNAQIGLQSDTAIEEQIAATESAGDALVQVKLFGDSNQDLDVRTGNDLMTSGCESRLGSR